MKTKTITIIFLLFISISSLFAQTTNYYYYKGQKQPLILDNSRIGVIVNKSDVSTVRHLASPIPFTLINIPQSTDNARYDFKLLKFYQTPDLTTYNQIISDLKLTKGVQMIQPCFLTSDNKELVTSEYLYVKLKGFFDENILRSSILPYSLEIVEMNQYMPLWYTLKCTNRTYKDCITIANALYETGKFAAVVPDLLSNDLLCSNDPEIENQWALKNTSNTGIDISACNAWINATGKGVKVAIVDQGIELSHNDLKRNIYSLSYDSETGTSPSKIYGDHATHCAGIVGAVKDNNLQIAGIAPDAKLISVSNSLYSTPNSRMKRADAINWAWRNGADIISNSWGSAVKFQAIDEAINNALTQGRDGKGCIVCFAAGNDDGEVAYPANTNPDILAVGSITSTGKRSNFSNYGNTLDIVAPGSNILSTVLNNNIDYKNGTSMACPYVAGVAALLLEKNPNLTVQEANDIIERNTKKIGNYSYSTKIGRPNGDWNNEMGYGLVDAFEVVSHAKPYDLLIRDSKEDSGAEPNMVTEYMWNSCDIWIRNEDDGGVEHENPICKSTPGYIYVRVKNNGTMPTTGKDFVEFRWAKAGISLSWPKSWYEGDRFDDFSIPLGGYIGSAQVDVLNPGEETIVKIGWSIPNPLLYENITPEPWHFCLLARIVSSNDPTPDVTYTDLNRYVKEFNNVAWKNVTVVEVGNFAQQVSGVVMVKNRFDVPKNYTIELIDKNNFYPSILSSTNELNKPQVSIELSPNIYNAWVRGGSIKQSLASSNIPRVQTMQGNSSILQNINLAAQEAGIVNVKFSVPSSGSIYNFRYTYEVVLKDENGNIVGGETYIVKRKTFRPIIPPTIKQTPEIENRIIKLEASDIEEPAIYNWYNSKGSLLATGKEVEVTANEPEKYKLEVIAEKDNYKCSAETTVKPLEGIISLSPNPSSGEVAIKFVISESKKSLIIVNSIERSDWLYEFPISPKENSIVIDTSTYEKGIYTVSLISDGNIVNTKKLVKK